jgi:hypothetical protein
MVLRTIIQSDDDFALFAFITIGTIGPNAMVNEIQTTATIPSSPTPPSKGPNSASIC